MTTEAKLKKLEEDQIIMEDQNCKLAKVRPGGPSHTAGRGVASGRRLGSGIRGHLPTSASPSPVATAYGGHGPSCMSVASACQRPTQWGVSHH